MRVSLLTAATREYWPVMRMSAPNKLRYCLRWNIQLSMREHRDWIPWGERERFMKDTLKECDWLWFMGADTLIMNHALDVRALLDDRFDLIIGADIHGINNDVFFLRNTPASFEFLERTLALNASFDNDQTAMCHVMQQMPDLKYLIAHQRYFNSYLYQEYTYPDDGGGTYQPGDFVLHLPGLSNSRRIEIMSEYTQRIVE